MRWVIAGGIIGPVIGGSSSGSGKGDDCANPTTPKASDNTLHTIKQYDLKESLKAEMLFMSVDLRSWNPSSKERRPGDAHSPGPLFCHLLP
jgi:hypothetical protein